MKSIKFNLLTIVLIMALFIIPIQVTPILADDIPIVPILKIGIITDVHVGNGGSETRLADFVNIMNQWQPNFVIQLGDAATGSFDNVTGGYTTISELDKFRTIYDKLTMPHYWVAGNHDVDVVSVDDWKAHAGISSDQYALTYGGIRFIIVNTQDSADRAINFLTSQLSSGNYTNIILGHKMLVTSNISINQMNGKDGWLMLGADNITQLLEASANVKMYISGHYHQNDYVLQNSVEYLTLYGSLSYSGNQTNGFSAMTFYSDGTYYLKGYGGQIDRGMKSASDNQVFPEFIPTTPPPAPSPPIPEPPIYYPPGVYSSGGGGGASVVGNKRSTSVYNAISKNGTVLEDIGVQSLDAKLNLLIPYKSIIKQENGKKIYTIAVEELTEAPSGNLTSKAYKITPDGTMFNSPISLSILYSANVSADSLCMANWDSNKKEWVALESKIDNIKHIITADITHFSTYALIKEAKVVEVVIPKSTPVQLTEEANQFDYHLTWAWFWSCLIR